MGRQPELVRNRETKKRLTGRLSCDVKLQVLISVPKGKKSGKARQRKSANKSGKKIGRTVGLYGTNALAPVSVRALKSIGFPATTHTTHRYIQSGTMVCVAGSLAIQQFRTNSMFDPDLTGTGHQPYGFDQWKTYYGTYMVKSSKITMEAAISGGIGLVGVYTSTESSTGFTSADTLGEPGRGQSGIVNTTFGGVRVFEARWTLRDIPNHDPADYSALVSTNPTNSDFYTIYVQDAFSLAGSPTVYWTVLIEFDVMWKDPLSFASS